MKWVGIVALVLVVGAFLYFSPRESVVRIEQPLSLQQEASPSSSEAPEAVELTVYQVEQSQPDYYYGGARQLRSFNINDGLALIKETRKALFPQGLTAFSMKGTAQYIDSTSLHFKDLTDAGTQVLEQNYQYDLVSQQKLLEKYIDKSISVKSGNETISGKLLSAVSGLVLQTSNGLVSLGSYDRIMYPSLPEGLITVPTIEWLLQSQKAGDHVFQVSYLASGLNWHADYVAVANADDSRMDVQGWVSLQNHAGATFKDAKLKLVAGDINLVRPQQAKYAYDLMRAEVAGAPAPQQFTQEGLFEYHLYTLQRPATLKDNEDKQIALMEASGVPVLKQFVFEPDKSTKVRVKLQFENKKEKGLGLPLPKGKVRVYKADSEGQLQFLGEDQIDHTPEDEKVRLFIGNAFDVIAEQKQTDYKTITSCVREASYSVDVRNHKDSNIKVQVFSNALYGEWEVLRESHPHTKEDSRHALWILDVPSKGSQTLTYTIRQEYC